MIEAFNPFQTRITFYVLLNAFFCFFTAIWLIGIFFTRRYLFIKPSMMLLMFSHIFFQWPLAIYSGYYENFVPDPYTFALLIHTYTVVGLLVAIFTFDGNAKCIWSRVTDPNYFESAVSTKAVLFLGGLVVFGVAVYLSYVPFTSTGLHAIFRDPSTAAIAREDSLKLLESQAVKYVYSLMVSSAAPLLAAMLTISLARKVGGGDVFSVPIHIALFLLLAVAVSMTGARVPVVNLMIVMGFVLLFHKGLPFTPVRYLLLLVVILLPPAVLSILREGEAVGTGIVFEYLEYLAMRTFVSTMDVGSWYVHYAQTHGFFGIGSIPKLAVAMGIEPVNTPNLIGLTYTDRTIESVSAVASFLFTYYSYFGIASLVFSIVGLWLLDVAVLVYEGLSNKVLLACVSAVNVSLLSFVSSEYTTAWLTHGFGVILLLSWLINHFVASSDRSQNDSVRQEESCLNRDQK